MDFRKRVINLEKRITSKDLDGAKQFVNAMIFCGEIKPENYDSALAEALEKGYTFKVLLDAIDGETVGPPSKRVEDPRSLFEKMDEVVAREKERGK